MDYPVRKSAHALEYTLLGILLVGACMDWDKKEKKDIEVKNVKHNRTVIGTANSKNHNLRFRFLIPWILGTVYAMTDEFHQLFVSRRSGQ